MKRFIRSILDAAIILCAFTLAGSVCAADLVKTADVKTANGTLEGAVDSGAEVRAFKGIPYAQPPIGDLRWKAPQPVKDWPDVRQADAFGPRAM